MADTAAPQTKDLRLGFITLREAETGFRCGVLVADRTGMPLELRVTDAVRPTAAQRVAYGESLRRAVVRVAASPLLEALQETPEVMLSDCPEFLSVHRETLPVVTLHPCDTSNKLSPDASDTEQEVLEGVSDRSRSIRVEFPRGLSPDVRASVRGVFRDLLNEMDMLEPFDRVGRAMELLDKQDSQKSQSSER
jgi:hypothetical protein